MTTCKNFISSTHKEYYKEPGKHKSVIFKDKKKFKGTFACPGDQSW